MPGSPSPAPPICPSSATCGGPELSSETPQAGGRASASGPQIPSSVPAFPHGTTVLAIRFQDGVLMAGDRQATEGFQVSGRRIEKVFRTDAHSAVARAGVAGAAI